MTGVHVGDVLIVLAVWSVASLLVGLVWIVAVEVGRWRQRCWDRHVGEALAVSRDRHPSARPVGPEDSAAWAQRWGVGRP